MGTIQNGSSSRILPRPKSSSALPISPTLRQSTPYMVALSGWPEPVYIAHDPASWPTRRSRPSSPRPTADGQIRDGIGVALPLLSEKNAEVIAAVPQESIWSRNCMYGEDCRVIGHPDHLLHDGGCYTPGVKRDSNSRTRTPRGSFDDGRSAPLSMSRQARADKEASPFPTSSTRSSATSPTQGHIPPPRNTRFADPRLMPNVAVLSNRPALTIAPSWTTSASLSPYPNRRPSVGTGVKVTAGSRGPGLLIMRSTSDIYPPPVAPAPPPGLAGMAVQMAGVRGVGMATEVYPRDPDSAILWRGTGEQPKSREGSADEDDAMEGDGDV